jgi:hypothetical protein
MALPKLRELDKYGVITDVDPFDLPLGAWSMGINVRFEDGKVTSAPVWRAVGAPLANANPRYVQVANRADNSTSILIGYKNGTVADWTSTAVTSVNPAGYVLSDAEATWSGCTLAEVVYVNREDRVPWSMQPDETAFKNLPGWNAGWRCKLIRSYASALIALNITKDGVRYPTMVKTSDIVADPGVEPTTWDETDPTNNATENLLTEMNGEIVDAATLGNSLILYSNSETWQMTADQSDDVYAYRRLPFSAGAINTNCVVEVNNRHYVFGSNDLWVHDGLSMESLADKRVRKWVFKKLNAKQADRFFVSYNPSHNTVSFNFVSGDEYVAFNGTGCNRAAVLHLSNNTWTFDDLPLVHGSGYAKVSLTSQTWANITATWDTVGGSWADLEDGFKRVMVYVGENTGGLSARLYARDLYGDGSILSSDVDTVATRPALLLRDGMDLDELDVDLRGYKVILGIYPQGRLDPSASPLTFTFGATDYPNVSPVYGVSQTYNAREDYKLDFTDAGRFLSMKMEYPDYKTMSLSGIDVDLDVLGER